MSMTVGSDRHWIMEIFVMPIIIAVGVFVFQFVVLMLVAVALDEVDQDAGNLQNSANQHPPAADALTE